MSVYVDTDKLGIMPWDDGTIPLAISSINHKYENTAVCNAVFWSQNKKSKNINPSKDLQNESSKLWDQYLNNTEFSRGLKKIITCGKIAREVICSTSWYDNSKTVLNLSSPSATYLSRVSGMFNENNLLLRYPEVNRNSILF